MTRIRRQIDSYSYLLDKIEKEGIVLSDLPYIEDYIDRAVSLSGGNGWDFYGNILKELIRDNNIDGLREVLLSPQGDRYRSISPLIILLLSPEEGMKFRSNQRVITPEMLTIF